MRAIASAKASLFYVPFMIAYIILSLNYLLIMETKILSIEHLSNFALQPQKTDFYLYNSEIFTQEEQSILQNIKAYRLVTQTKAHEYDLNVRVLQGNLDKTPIFMLHGHGATCVWAVWIRLGLQLWKDGFSIIMMDLPGYGKSTADKKDRVNPKYYMGDCANMIISVLDAFKIQKVNTVGFCGGAANFIRSITTYPGRFGQNHVFHNSVISAIPDTFEKILNQHKMRLWVSWCVDPDHTKQCVGYKYFALKTKQLNSRIRLQDITTDEMPCLLLWSKKMGRNTSDIEIFDPSQGYTDFVIKFMNNQNVQYCANPVMYQWGPEQALTQLKEQSQFSEEDIELGIALSLSLT